MVARFLACNTGAITADDLIPSPAAAPGPDLVSAATVILVRDGSTGLEVLLLRRDTSLAFAAGAWVFPGGRVDGADLDAAGGVLERAEELAAVRECQEEAGLALAHTSLVRWSHWTPPDQQQRRRFSTAFFVVAAPDGDVVIDDGEIRAHQWVAPTDAISAHGVGDLPLSPPTYITLVQLGAHRDVASLLTHATSAEPEHFSTHIVMDGSDVLAVYHGDVAYDSGDASAEGPQHRLIMRDGPWTYRRDPA